MTGEAKKRCEELADKYAIENYGRDTVPGSLVARDFKQGFQAGYNDPDRQGILDDLIKSLEELYYPVAKTRDMGVYNKAVNDAIGRVQKLKAARG